MDLMAFEVEARRAKDVRPNIWWNPDTGILRGVEWGGLEWNTGPFPIYAPQGVKWDTRRHGDRVWIHISARKRRAPVRSR